MRAARWRRATSAMLVIAALSAAPAWSSAVGSSQSAAAVRVPANDPFYTAPDPIPAVPPGTVLRSRAVKIAGFGVPLPFKAWHVMYASTDAKDAPSAAVATIIKPLLQAPGRGPALVSYQTAWDSVSLDCAPSYRMRKGDEKEEIAILPLLALGWTVVVPDYEGLLGAYTAGIQAAHGVLDGIRAALSFGPSGLRSDTPVGMWGYSGGGLATAWAAEFAPSYAPELNIAGVAAGGVPPNITAVAKNLDGGLFSGIVLAGSVGMSRAYPELTSLWNTKGQRMAANIATMCIDEYVSAYSFEKMDTYTTVPGAIDLEWVQDIMELNRLGARTPRAPLFIYQSVNDELIPVADVNELVAEYCDEGVTVAYYQDLASEHITLAFTGGPLAISYLASRFAGVPAPTTCALPILPPLT